MILSGGYGICTCDVRYAMLCYVMSYATLRDELRYVWLVRREEETTRWEGWNAGPVKLWFLPRGPRVVG